MDYPRELQKAGRKAAKSQRQAETDTEARDYVIYHAHTDGGMSFRDIAGHVGVNFQRVAQIIAKRKP